MIIFSLHERLVEIPLQGMGTVRFSICSEWGLQALNLFTPPLNKLCFNAIPRRGILIPIQILKSLNLKS